MERREEESAVSTSAADLEFDRLLGELLDKTYGVVGLHSRLRSLLDAVMGMSMEQSLDGVLARILSAARALTGARYAALGVLGEGSEDRIRTFVHQGMDDAVAQRIGALPTGRGLLGLLIDDPRPIRQTEISSHPQSSGFPSHHPPMSSFLGLPIRIRGRVFGNLYLTEKLDGAEFTDGDEAIVAALAAAAAVAIENARLHEDLVHRQAWVSAAAEITATLADDRMTGSALQLVADRARETSGADASWVLLGSTPEDLRLEVISGPPADLEAMRALPMKQSLASTALATGEMLRVEDVTQDPRAVDPSAVAGWPRLGPVMVLPLQSGRGVEGVLSLAWTPEHVDAYHQVVPELPVNFAEQATLAIQVARSRDDSHKLEMYEERDRIGRDLHDTVVQQLFAVGLGLQTTAKLSSEPQVSARIERAIGDLDDTIKDVRRTIFALGALETSADLQSEVERVVERAGAAMKLKPTLHLEGPVRSAVGPSLAPAVLAVLSEALANVSRHARAGSVQVELAVRSDHLLLRVSDDGVGMAAEPLESGLANMRVRAQQLGGDLAVDSEPGRGTTILWTVPLPSRGEV